MTEIFSFESSRKRVEGFSYFWCILRNRNENLSIFDQTIKEIWPICSRLIRAVLINSTEIIFFLIGLNCSPHTPHQFFFFLILRRIGRHSKSLDTQRFVCALCTGQLVLLTPSKPRAPAPFATFLKENYGNARQELAGQSHGEVMRKLSTDFASKTKLGESWMSGCTENSLPLSMF